MAPLLDGPKTLEMDAGTELSYVTCFSAPGVEGSDARFSAVGAEPGRGRVHIHREVNVCQHLAG